MVSLHLYLITTAILDLFLNIALNSPSSFADIVNTTATPGVPAFVSTSVGGEQHVSTLNFTIKILNFNEPESVFPQAGGSAKPETPPAGHHPRKIKKTENL